MTASAPGSLRRPASAPLSSVLGVDPRAQLVSLMHVSHDLQSDATRGAALAPAAEASPLRAADARRTIAAIRARTASSASRVADSAERRRKMLHVPPAAEPQLLRPLSSGRLHSLHDFDCGPPLPRSEHHQPVAPSTSRPEEERSAGSLRLSARGSVRTKLRGQLKHEWAQSWQPAHPNPKPKPMVNPKPNRRAKPKPKPNPKPKPSPNPDQAPSGCAQGGRVLAQPDGRSRRSGARPPRRTRACAAHAACRPRLRAAPHLRAAHACTERPCAERACAGRACTERACAERACAERRVPSVAPARRSICSTRRVARRRSREARAGPMLPRPRPPPRPPTRPPFS